MAPRILTSQLHTGDRSASRPRAALPQEKEPRHPLDKGLGGPQSRSGRRGGNKNPSTCQELKPSRSGRSLVTIRTELSRLHQQSNKLAHRLLQTESRFEILPWRAGCTVVEKRCDFLRTDTMFFVLTFSYASINLLQAKR